jgi:hypothetical protein
VSYDWLVALSLVKFLAAFAFFFIYLPTKIFPQRRDAATVERFFDNLVLMTATGIVFVHLLALLQMYSIVTVLLCYLLLYIARVWRREQVFPLELLRTFLVQKTVLILDILDSVVDVRAATREFVQKKWLKWKERAGDRQAVIHVLLFGTILIYAAALRYADVFSSPAFVFSDPYSHLLWMKQLESGVLYPENITNQYYPKGFHAFTAILHGLSGLDGALSLRLVGPLVGTLLVACVYYVSKKLTQSGEVALVGMFLFGTFIEPLTFLNSYFEDGVLDTRDAYYPRWFFRQITPLPEEFALLFLMPALLAAYFYLTERSRRAFLLFCLASIIIFMTHSLVAVALGVGLTTLVALSFVLRVLSWQTLKALIVAGIITALLGNLQLIYGWFFDDTVQAAVTDYAAWGASSWRTLPYTLEILASAGLGVIFLAGGLLLAQSKATKLLWGFYGLYLLLLAFLGRAGNFGILYLISPDRLDHYRVFFLSSALAGAYSLATCFPVFAAAYRRRRWVHQTMTVVLLTLLAAVGFPSEIPAPPRYEYDALADVSYRIKRAFPPLEWTLVSTTEEFSKVYKDKGWHMNVAEFLESYDPYDTELELPTPYTFLFVEKRLFSKSSDPALNRPGVRLDLERRLQEWTNLYNLLHHDMSIYYEDWDSIVYLITNTPPPKTTEDTLQAVNRGPELAMTVFDGLKRLWRRGGS